jgi:hypothetical protein
LNIVLVFHKVLNLNMEKVGLLETGKDAWNALEQGRAVDEKQYAALLFRHKCQEELCRSAGFDSSLEFTEFWAAQACEDEYWSAVLPKTAPKKIKDRLIL